MPGADPRRCGATTGDRSDAAPRSGPASPAARPLLLVLALAACLQLAPAGWALGEPVSKDLDGVSVTVHAPWPSGLLGGWMPCSVRYHNERGRSVTVQASVVQANLWTSSATSSVNLQPGERHEAEWLVPVFSSADTSLSMNVWTSSGARALIPLSTDPSTTILDDRFTLVSLAPGEPEPEWSAALPPATRGNPIYAPTYVRHDALPSDWRAYTSLARLVLSTDHGLPDDAVVDALLAWVAAGGVLQVVGEARGLELPLDDRFRREPEQDHPAHLSLHRHGLGWIQRTRVPHSGLTPNWSLPFGDERGPLEDLLAPGALPVLPAWADTSIPGLRSIPMGLLGTILVIFFLVMGPLQFFVLRRRKAAPVALLLTTPALGFGFAALLLGAGLLQQGLDVREAVSSLTWLDQTRHHAATVARRTVFSGSVFDTALRYDAGTAVHNLSARMGTRWQGRTRFTAYRTHVGRVNTNPPPVSVGGDAYRVDLDRHVLDGAFLPVRVPTCELLSRSAPARQRLALEEEGGRLYAVNDLGVELLDLWVHDEFGRTWHLVPPRLGPGERGELERGEPPPGSIGFTGPLPEALHLSSSAVRRNNERHWPDLGPLPAQAPDRCYVALLADSPFLDDGGVERRVVASRHVLFGDLGPAP